MFIYKIFENICLKFETFFCFCAKYINWNFFQPIVMFFNDCAWYWDDKINDIRIAD